ncbi:MAG: DUF2461 domain-containing protein [Chloroflexi bacterium AL-W]|nr:DUF2461 domain-containing protein [Chloroflexi bacterium AL-N1]NOK64799.1 DUF2461 domain-containing protein [Chloroflexi bacterium AL-N10]NOK76569.1 DUF2461 domain-containing protein [Chloroflexi bacterium AL-N5]NOK80201.1 DUF2461 domain-containing protein [Chloroflexi bacterium AL-W]NOK86714.1 DUF2461 domain-containing protein [Chloroflexi bacterium AL-N15]
MTTFQGFPSEARTFFGDIRENNNKEWFEQHKPRFKTLVQQPAQELVVALGEQLKGFVPGVQYNTQLNGSGSIMRIYRDTRFSKDKSPYKTNLGVVWWEGSGKKMEEPCFYFNLDAEGVWLAGGLYIFPKHILEPYRHAVIDERLGPALETAIIEVQANGVSVEGEQYRTVPRGFDKAHPRAELLKYQGMISSPRPIPEEVWTSSALVDVCVEYFRSILPLHQWLVRMVQIRP